MDRGGPGPSGLLDSPPFLPQVSSFLSKSLLMEEHQSTYDLRSRGDGGNKSKDLIPTP